MADEEKPEMPLSFIFSFFIGFQALIILCLLYAILKKFRRIHFELRVQARRLRRKQTEIELKEMKEIVKQTKQLAHVQRDFMME